MDTSHLDIPRLKAMVIALWRRGGGDTLVKASPIGMVPNAGFSIGYCTSIKYLIGRTPPEIEEAVGLARGSKLAVGADIFVVDPLPLPGQFEMRGYSQTPAGIPVTPATPYNPAYPPGLGLPQWELTRYPQSGMRRIASVLAGQRFTFPVSTLPPVR